MTTKNKKMREWIHKALLEIDPTSILIGTQMVQEVDQALYKIQIRMRVEAADPYNLSTAISNWLRGVQTPSIIEIW